MGEIFREINRKRLLPDPLFNTESQISTTFDFLFLFIFVGHDIMEFLIRKFYRISCRKEKKANYSQSQSLVSNENDSFFSFTKSFRPRLPYLSILTFPPRSLHFEGEVTKLLTCYRNCQERDKVLSKTIDSVETVLLHFRKVRQFKIGSKQRSAHYL